jgi:predicted DNA-binding transcriptional regulator AlpA
MSTETQSPHLTVRQLAARWQTTEQAIYNLRNRRKLPRAFKRGRNLLWPVAAIEAHEASQLAADCKSPAQYDMRPPEPVRRRTVKRRPTAA